MNIQGLHLKLDKKLVLKCDNIEIKENNDTQPLYVDPSWINGSVKIFDFLIEKLQIDKLTTNGHNFFIKYEDLNFFVDSEIFKSKGSILVANETLNGSFEFNIPNTQLILQVMLKIKGAEVEYKINTNGISNFEFLKKYLQLDENVAAWIYEKTSVDLLKIKDISGKFNINRLTDFTLRDLNSVVLVENLLLNYQYGKPPLHIKSLDVTKVDNHIVAKIKNVQNLQSQLSVSGNLNLNIDLSKIDFDGKIYFHDIVIDSNVSLQNQILDINLRSNEFKDPKVFKEIVEIPSAIEKWGFNRLSASSYQIDSLVAKIFLPHAILDKESLKVHATLKDITMDFNPKKAYPLVAKKVDVVFENGNINFELEKPFSNDVNLSGSRAVIYDLFSKSGLLLDLQSVSPLNETLVRVVESYGVSLPRELNLSQLKGESDIKTKIDIPFGDDPTKIFVTIKNKNSIMQIKDQNVSFENFDFLFENNEVHIKNTQAWVDQKKIDANISFYTNSGQALLDASIEDINHTIALKISNSTNLVKKISTGTIDVDKFSPTSELDICNLVLPYTVYFDKNIDTYLPTLMIRDTLDPNEGLHTINVDSFEMLYKLLDQNQTFPKYYGNLKATTKNFRDINISTNIAALDYPIFDGDEKIKSIHVDLFVDNLNQIRL
ncbi:MAG: hypothetical protein IE909_04645, partial [Campylobacterales bacterium]|nr:hypothetical protein [Campylobacterales bacterium]